MTERWVVVGGTFDPVHVGHLHIARAAATALGASLAVLAVGEAHPHREPTVLDRPARVALVRTALAGEPGLVEAGQLGVDDGSLVTVVQRLAVRAELHVVFGADSAAKLGGWAGLPTLQQHATVWAVPRPGVAVGPGALPVPTLAIPTLDSSAGRIRETGNTDDVPCAIRGAVLAAYNARRVPA